MNKRIISFSEAIKESLDQNLEQDPKVYVMGLGVPDPKGIFGTTLGLAEKYGPDRVMDMPTSENGMTGIAIGSALNGMKPIMTHQRADFFLLAFDQLINTAAKWHYMFAGQKSVPLVIRLIVGRGWGQGPQHSQNLHAALSHFPGLKVVMPTTAHDAKGLLNSSIQDPNPVVFIEHRWLHHIVDHVPENYYLEPLGKAKVIHSGNDLTVVASSHAAIEALKAAKECQNLGMSVEVIDLRTIKPFDFETVWTSVQKTGRLLVVDDSWKTLGLASEIITSVVEKDVTVLKHAPQRLTLPDCYAPTSHALAEDYYVKDVDIIKKISEMLAKKVSLSQLIEEKQKRPSDVPDQNFTGPF